MVGGVGPGEGADGGGAGVGEPPNIIQAPPAPSTSTPAMAAITKVLRRGPGETDADGAGDGAMRGLDGGGGPWAPVAGGAGATGATAGRAGAGSEKMPSGSATGGAGIGAASADGMGAASGDGLATGGCADTLASGGGATGAPKSLGNPAVTGKVISSESGGCSIDGAVDGLGARLGDVAGAVETGPGFGAGAGPGPRRVRDDFSTISSRPNSVRNWETEPIRSSMWTASA